MRRIFCVLQRTEASDYGSLAAVGPVPANFVKQLEQLVPASWTQSAEIDVAVNRQLQQFVPLEFVGNFDVMYHRELVLLSSARRLFVVRRHRYLNQNNDNLHVPSPVYASYNDQYDPSIECVLGDRLVDP